MSIFRLLALFGCLLFAFSSSALARDLRGSSDYPFADNASGIYPHEAIAQLTISSAGGGDGIVVDDSDVSVGEHGETLKVVECNAERITLRICLSNGACLTVEKNRRTGHVIIRYDHSPDEWWVPVLTYKLVCDGDGNCRIEDAFGIKICDIAVVDGVLGFHCSYLLMEFIGVFQFNEHGQFCYSVTGGIGAGCRSLDPQGHPLAPLMPYILPFGEDFWPVDWPNREGDETDICASLEE